MPESGFTPEQIDTTTPHPARMYDYYLGGMDNYEADRKAAERVMLATPDARPTARGNRDFHHRAVRTVVNEGVRQIIDIGTGIPTSPNTHEVAREVAPDTHVAYVDNDPIVATYAGAKLTNSGNASFVLGDLRDPRAILDDPTTRELIDFSRPVALMLVAVLHFIADEEDPAKIVSTLTEPLAEGSFLILSHVTADFFEKKDVQGKVSGVYKSATAGLSFRDRDQVMSFFSGFDLLEPGLVQPPLWRPDGPVPTPDELRHHAGYAGVAVKRG